MSATWTGAGGLGKLTSTKELRLEVHVIEGVDGLIVVGLDLSCIAKVWLVAESCWNRSHGRGAKARGYRRGQGGPRSSEAVIGLQLKSHPTSPMTPRAQEKCVTMTRNRCFREIGVSGRKLTLGDVLESLVGSHDCGLVKVEKSRSSTARSRRVRKRGVTGIKIRRLLVEGCEGSLK